jgi:hypothetical protein
MANSVGQSTEALAAIVQRDLEAYGDALAPGAAQHLGRAWNVLGSASEGDRAAEIARRLDEPYAYAYLNHDHKPMGSELSRAIARNADKLRPGAAEALEAELAPRVLNRPAPEIARLVAGHLARPAANAHLTPEAHVNASPADQRLSAKIGQEFPMLSGAGLEKLVRERGREFARMDDRTLILAVATMLRSPVVAARYNTPAIAPTDYRLAPQPLQWRDVVKPEQPRQADGRFAQPPAAPRKNRISF